MELERVPLWRGEHVPIKQLVEDFGRYLYLPRLKEPAVLVQAVRDGLGLLTWSQESFAFADGYDDAQDRYRGLRSGQGVALSDEDPIGLLVRPERALKQQQADAAAATVRGPGPTVVDKAGAPGGPLPTSPAEAAKARRFHGTAALDPTRVGRDAGRIADEVISHLAGLVGADVSVTLEIAADVPAGVPDHVVRTVTENARTLKFKSQGFETE
jgi:hypothetical protein